MRSTVICGKSGLYNQLCYDLLAWFEWQRLPELNRDTSKERVYVIDAADMARASEVGYVKGVVAAVLRNTKTSRKMLAKVWTVLIGVACKCGTCAGYINHLPLRQ